MCGPMKPWCKPTNSWALWTTPSDADEEAPERQARDHHPAELCAAEPDGDEVRPRWVRGARVFG
jgi:hypothetical protein